MKTEEMKKKLMHTYFCVPRFEKQELHEMQDELEDLRDCGLSGCRPKIMQPLANIKVSKHEEKRRKI